jgi:flagellar L-ring protein FlgH
MQLKTRRKSSSALWGARKNENTHLSLTIPLGGGREGVGVKIGYFRAKTGLLWVGMAFMALSCAATSPEFKKERPSSYVKAPKNQEQRLAGSLYREVAGLYEDRKARGLNDLVTINIIENSSASKKADTATGRNSTMDANISNLFGGSLHYDLENLFGKGSGLSGTLMPTIQSNYKNDFSGAGNTSRQGSLIATITARVVEVLPNGNFLIESRKDVTVNREKQVLLLRGVIRPEDIAVDNTIPSNYVAEAEMIYAGEGVVSDKQGQGWLVRFLDFVWPF